MGSTDSLRLGGRERRLSEPPPRIAKSPVISSNLTGVVNGTLREGKVEEGEEEEEEGEVVDDEMCVLPLPHESTL